MEKKEKPDTSTDDFANIMFLKTLIFNGYSKATPSKVLRIVLTEPLTKAEKNDVWLAVDNLKAYVTVERMHGARTHVPLEILAQNGSTELLVHPNERKTQPKIVDGASMINSVLTTLPKKPMSFVIVNNEPDNSLKEMLSELSETKQVERWLAMPDFYYAMQRAAHSMGIKQNMPSLPQDVPIMNPSYHQLLFQQGLSFFRQQRPRAGVAGFYLTPLNILLVAPDCRAEWKPVIENRVTFCDNGHQNYHENFKKTRIKIKEGTIMETCIYTDELSVPRGLQDFPPANLYYSSKTSFHIDVLETYGSGKLGKSKMLITTTDTELDFIVFQWKPERVNEKNFKPREIFTALDYIYQNPHCNFLFIEDFPEDIDNWEINDDLSSTTRYMFSLGFEDSVVAGETALDGVDVEPNLFNEIVCAEDRKCIDDEQEEQE